MEQISISPLRTRMRPQTDEEYYVLRFIIHRLADVDETFETMTFASNNSIGLDMMVQARSLLHQAAACIGFGLSHGEHVAIIPAHQGGVIAANPMQSAEMVMRTLHADPSMSETLKTMTSQEACSVLYAAIDLLQEANFTLQSMPNRGVFEQVPEDAPIPQPSEATRALVEDSLRVGTL